MSFMTKYEPGKIEKKWQEKWEKGKLYQAVDFSKKPKKYILIEFPYPSGERLHVGHGRSYTALDAYSRMLRMQGNNVLYPIGWDAFGLPAENYAIKTGINPAITTAENIKNAKAQAKSWGLSFDWSREINTTDPEYYKWTQWIFLKLLEKGLAYQAEVPVNWCPFCKTNLADEEVLADGTHERCGNKTEKRLQRQWILKITAYAQRLLDDLKTVNYLPKIALQQINWIGKKEGVAIKFPISNSQSLIEVFTTRPDTLFGATYLVLAPEHHLISSLREQISNWNEVDAYIKEVQDRKEGERFAEMKDKSGVELKGIKALNPASQEEIPVWVADYVLGEVGTGAIMAVPAHDQRDFDFAKKFNLPVRVVVKPTKEAKEEALAMTCHDGPGILINSGKFDGLASEKAKDEITKLVGGEKAVQYHLHDWVFSRQHYWGEPIPVVHCPKCGVVPVPEKDLPVELPYVEKYQPTGTGESPLAAVKEWVNVACPECGGKARRETDTMPNWAGSNWYFVRYIDPHNDKSLADKKKLDYWMPVDLYNGGMEHTTLHLLYSRFIYKFLSDVGVVPGNEPYARRHSHGVVLGPDGQKMSKSRGNVINPDEVVAAYGADTFRLYEMFMGPFEEMIAWNDESMMGCHRFLKRVWQLSQTKTKDFKTPQEVSVALQKTVRKVSQDLEALKFNTAVATMMEFINIWAKPGNFLNKKDAKIFLQILAPFAPHISEELWSQMGGKFSIHASLWPQFDTQLIKEKIVTIIIEVNGKLRDKLIIKAPSSKLQSEIEKLARKSAKINKYLAGKKVQQVIFVPGRLINFVV